MISIKRLDAVEGNRALTATVIEVAVRRSGDNDELLVVALEHLEGGLAEVAAVRLLAMHHHDSALDLARVGE